MRLFAVRDMLVYYDRPLLFLSEDVSGCRYLCVLVEDDEPMTPVYLCRQISSLASEQVESGAVDAWSAFSESESEGFRVSGCVIDDVLICSDYVVTERERRRKG